MMRLRFLILLNLLFAVSLLAQNATINAVLLDATTNEPVVGATFRAKNGGAISDLAGKITFQLEPGTHNLSITFPGYETVEKLVSVKAGQILNLVIKMTDGNNILQQATVTAGKFEKPLGKVTVSLDVLKPRLIESVNATSIDNALVKIPGVAVQDGQISIRGGAGFSYGAGTRVLLLMDDIPALQADAGFPNWSDFAVENVGQIEVLKGAASALYGSSAMNGIVNMRTNFAKDKPETDFAVFTKLWDSPRDPAKQWWGRDTAEWEVPIETGFSAAHRRKSGKWDIVLGTYGLMRNSYQRNTQSRYGRFTPNFRYRVNDRLTIGLNSNFNFGSSSNFFIWANDGTGAYQAGLNSQGRSLGRFRFTIDPTVQYFDKSGNRHKFLGRYFYINNKNDNNQANSSENYYAEYQFQRSLNSGLVITAGAVNNFTNLKNPTALYNFGTYTNQNYAGYLQLDQEWFDRLNLSAGVRWEQNTLKNSILFTKDGNKVDTIRAGSNRESKPVFRVGANYQVGTATFIRASWGQGYRYPTIAEKFIGTTFGGGNLVSANPNLVSETGWTAELGIKQGIKVGKWIGFVDVTGFISEYDNMMEFILSTLRIAINPGPPPRLEPQAIFQSQNTGNTRVSGYETSLIGQGELGPGTLALMAGFTYFKPIYRDFTPKIDESSSVDYNVLKYRFRNQLKWDSEYKYKKVSIGVSVLYNSHMEAIDAIFEAPVTEPFRAVKRFRDQNNKGFSLVDIRAAVDITKSLKANFIVGNLTNVEYTMRPALLEAPRNFTLRLDYKIR
jgi:outer membrane receptor protein involved in Fe transport